MTKSAARCNCENEKCNRVCPCSAGAECQARGHIVGGCNNPGEVRTVFGAVCEDCAIYLPSELLESVNSDNRTSQKIREALSIIPEDVLRQAWVNQDYRYLIARVRGFYVNTSTAIGLTATVPKTLDQMAELHGWERPEGVQGKPHNPTEYHTVECTAYRHAGNDRPCICSSEAKKAVEDLWRLDIDFSKFPKFELHGMRPVNEFGCAFLHEVQGSIDAGKGRALLTVLTKVAEAYEPIPDSDLDNEQPRSVSLTLREIRAAARFLDQLKRAAVHVKDSDCTVDPQTLSCFLCGVDHSGTCPTCGGKGFHVTEKCEAEWTASNLGDTE